MPDAPSPRVALDVTADGPPGGKVAGIAAPPTLDTRPRALRLAAADGAPQPVPFAGAGWQAGRHGRFVLATLGITAGAERGVVTALLDPHEARRYAAALTTLADEALR